MITNETITARFAADRHATIAWKQQLSADLDVIVAAYGAADKPADTIAAAAAEIGIDRVRAIIATLTVYRVAMYDRRISDDTAAWAQTIADALDDDAPGDYDATLRDFIRCDDAHIAWYAPQCEITWRPGDAAREGARV